MPLLMHTLQSVFLPLNTHNTCSTDSSRAVSPAAYSSRYTSSSRHRDVRGSSAERTGSCFCGRTSKNSGRRA